MSIELGKVLLNPVSVSPVHVVVLQHLRLNVLALLLSFRFLEEYILTISSGFPILPADLNSIWSTVTTIQALRATSRYEIDVASFNFDSTIEPDSRLWVPSTDAQILGAIVVAGSPSIISGTATFQLNGNINEPFVITGTVTVGASVRTFTAAPSGMFSVLAGDVISLDTVSIPGVSLGPTLLRVHILYKTKWSRI